MIKTAVSIVVEVLEKLYRWVLIRRRRCPAVHPHPHFGGRCEDKREHGLEHYRTLPFGGTVRWFYNWQSGWEPPHDDR